MKFSEKQHSNKIFRGLYEYFTEVKKENVFFLKNPLITTLTMVCFFLTVNISHAQYAGATCPSPDLSGAPYICGPPAHCDCSALYNGIVLETAP
ncbi:MAG TPA: hypothetical protein VN922_06515, partial [Bacteroidia bacterium]|nr:hypothetical protein [Bacteroidia bacterium]